MQDKLGFGGGPALLDVSFGSPFDCIVLYDDFVLNLVALELCFVFINYALTPLFDSALWLVAQVRIHSSSGYSLYMFRFPYVHDRFEHPLIFLSIATFV